jgi:hypothetical protein
VAVVAGAGKDGISEERVVAARRAYARHLGLELSGPVQDGDSPSHIEWAVRNNNHVANADQPINLRAAVPSKGGGRYYIT